MGRHHFRFWAVILAALSLVAEAIPAVAQQETSRLAGTVVGPDGSPVKNAVIRGLYFDRGRGSRAPIRLVSNAAGEFRLERKPGALWLYATASEGAFAGRTQVPAQDQTVTIKLAPAATVVGRLVENEVPVAGAHLACRLTVRGTNSSGRKVRNVFETGAAETAFDGRFVFPGLIVGDEYELLVKEQGFTSVDEKGTTARGWFSLPLKVEAPGKIDQGCLEFPLPQCVTVTPKATNFEIESNQLAAIRFYAKTELATRISAAQDDARLEHRKVVLVLGDPQAEATRSLVVLFDGLERADSFQGFTRSVPAALRTKLAQQAGIPEVDVTKEFTRRLADFERVPVNVKDKAAASHLAQTYHIDASRLVLPALAVLDENGSIADLQSFRAEGEPPEWDAKKLRVFLKHHGLPALDAEKLLTDARHRAGQENKRILLLESDPRSYASRLLIRFIDKHRQLFERDYVNVNIDACRSTKGAEVIEQFRKSTGSVPWMAILDAKGNKLNDSDGPAGNIGFPSEPEAINYFVDQMLKTTAQRLTPNELEALRAALRIPQKSGMVEIGDIRYPPGPPLRVVAAVKKPGPPRAPIYDPKANAKDDIAVALKTAKRENKRVLIEFGGNSCGSCYVLYDVFKKNAEVSAILNRGFVLILVDIGANRELFEHYVEQDEPHGIPFLTVLDADGKVLRNQRTDELEQPPEYDKAKVIAFLQQWSSK